ncbi:hypothetical protein ACIBI4_06215 [Streptomyces sp. NPDC050418]|uniref:hypothetical protein n=1 Tax=Streptomyces sp. NPDC050418 TaxID=3365612 RepID=UPI0037945F42
MTLDDLRAVLAGLEGVPGDTPVILSKDAEGNRFSPLVEVEHAMYLADSTYSGERYISEAERLAKPDPEEYAEAPEDAVPAIFLWPVN